MMRSFLIFLVLLCAAGSAAQEAPTPIGPASWLKPDGKIQHAMGPGGAPVLNYQVNDSTWDWIVDDWVPIGEKQAWKSVRGEHRVFADSTGAAIYAKGRHYLGTQTTHLIKFNKLDSTWVTLRASDPDSVTTAGNRITFHGIFPGVDKTLENNPKIFRQYAETFTFHQEARDLLALWGPWANRLLGTATRLNVDSLNLSWRDALGLFDIDAAGRLTDGWVSAMNGDTAVFSIAGTYLQTADSMVLSIPVHKRLVLLSGTPYLVELFNPIAANALPEGTLYHHAMFGDTSSTESTTQLNDKVKGTEGVVPASSGTGDSLYVKIRHDGLVNDSTMMALYNYDTPAAQGFIQNTAIRLVANAAFAWVGFAFTEPPTITAGTRYGIAVWCDNDNAPMYVAYSATSPADSTHSATYDWEGNNHIFPDPFEPSTLAGYIYQMYCIYTETGGEPGEATPSRRRQLLLQQHGSIQDITEHFAGVADEIPD